MGFNDITEAMLLRIKGPKFCIQQMYGHYIVPLLNAGYINKMDSQKENPRAEGILKGFRVYHHV